jgi:hypothetical protein
MTAKWEKYSKNFHGLVKEKDSVLKNMPAVFCGDERRETKEITIRNTRSDEKIIKTSLNVHFLTYSLH